MDPMFSRVICSKNSQGILIRIIEKQKLNNHEFASHLKLTAVCSSDKMPSISSFCIFPLLSSEFCQRTRWQRKSSPYDNFTPLGLNVKSVSKTCPKLFKRKNLSIIIIILIPLIIVICHLSRWRRLRDICSASFWFRFFKAAHATEKGYQANGN